VLHLLLVPRLSEEIDRSRDAFVRRSSFVVKTTTTTRRRKAQWGTRACRERAVSRSSTKTDEAREAFVVETV
jgi:hypothetical protein